MASVIRWKYLRNLLLSLGDGRHYAIPCTIRATPISAPFIQPMPGQNKGIDPAFRTFDETLGLPTAPMPHFDMSHVNETSFPDINPVVPDRSKHPEWSDAFFAKIEEQAFVKAIEARARMATVLQAIAHHVQQGHIEIVSDEAGLLSDNYLTLSDAEKAIAGIKIEQKRDPNVIDTNDLVAEGKALAGVTKAKK